ncbi:flagellar filament capping protein FliD [Duganella callida]|uniref:Flagellar hook-associated protein 2 n=1 Tax=Duganella callida TaxID=2561932 RepID=A0A4Y9SCG7_9BURK|nr:flagellar filament capping protein FliD [Duganella callida]TFW18015.1 flagellar hook 2 domain-containing protein [Duganella callida]
MATSSVTSTTSSNSSQISTDVYNRVQQTMSQQNTGASKLNDMLTKDQTKLSALGQLQSALSSFQSIAAALSGNGLSTSAGSSSKSVLTATSTGSAKSGSYAVEVKQLAQGQFLTSDSFPAADSKIGGGALTTVKIDFGTAASPFAQGDAASKTITIDSSNNTLDGIAAAFKDAGMDVKVVKDSDGKASLSIVGPDGAANSMRISVSGDAALKNLLAFDPDGTQKLKQTQAAQDAILSVDGGKEIRSASNTIKDSAIAGATLNLVAAGKSDVTITQDASQIGNNLKAFVAAYNDLNAKMQALQKGDLKSDTAMTQAANAMGMLLKTGGGLVSTTALAAAGVTQDKNGNMVIDDSKLQAALSKDSAAVGKLFTNDGKGIADLMAAKAASLTSSSSVLAKETTLTSNDITSVNHKRAALSKALTAQANALAAFYTAQAQAGGGSAINGTGAGSLFDILG